MLITLRLPICNVFLLTGQSPILIDTGRPRDAAAILAGLARHGVAPADLSLLVHTHGHWDHCGSSAGLRQQTSAPVAIHRADAPMMRRGDNGVLRPVTLSGRLGRRLLDRAYPPVKPDVLIDGDFDLAPYGASAKVIPTPGHTAGSISIWTEERDVIVGDLVMGGFLGGRLLPRLPGYHYFADDVDAVHASVRRLLEMKPRAVHAGHGGPLAPERLERWLDRRG